MTGFNRATLVGNLGADPEIRRTQSGDSVGNFRMATGESWKDKNTGEKKESTEWHSVVVFGKLAEVVEKYLRKGSKVLVEGKIRTRKWQDKSGADRYMTEIVLGIGSTLIMLDAKSDRPPAAESEAAYGSHRGDEPKQKMREELDDEIPF